MTNSTEVTGTRALVIDVDGGCSFKFIDGYDDLSDVVGGRFGFFGGNGEWTGYVDDEGKLKGLPANVTAVALALRLGWHSDDWFYGPVVFFGPEDGEGWFTEVSEWVLDHVRLGR